MRSELKGVVLCLLLAVARPGWLYGQVVLGAQGPSGLELEFQAGDLAEVTDSQGNWLGLAGKDFTSLRPESARYQVPVKAYLVGIPEGCYVNCEVSDVTSYKLSNYVVAPLLAWWAGNLAELPARPAEVTHTGYLRRQRVAGLRIAPVVYDPTTGGVVVYTGFKIHLDFVPASAADDFPLQVGGLAREDESSELFYRRALLNYDQARRWRVPLGRAARSGDYFSSSAVWIKVRVESTGIYCITGSDLAKLGMATQSIDPATIRLYGGGGLPLHESLSKPNPDWMQLVALRIGDGGDGRFDTKDSILFYGLGVNDWANLYDPTLGSEDHYESFFSNYNCYWLTWGGSFAEPPRRMETVVSGECDGCSYYQPTSFFERIHLEENNYDDFNIHAEDGWYWRPLNINNAVPLTVPTPWPDTNKPAVIRMRIADQHISETCASEYYRAILRLNNRTVQDTTWPAYDSPRRVVDVYGKGFPKDAGQQVVEVILPGSLPPPYQDQSVCHVKPHLAWCELYYWRRFISEGRRLFFTAPDTTALVKYQVEGLASSQLYIFDVTDQFGIKEIQGFQLSGQKDFAVAFFDSSRKGQARRYAVVSAAGMLKPSQMTEAQLANIRYSQSRPYCVVTHQDLLAAGDAISLYHDGEVVTVQQIYDEFGWGVPDVTAIRDFLKWRYENGQLEHVLLLGDATWDYKGYLRGDTFTNYVPSYERRYLPPVGDPYNTDDWFVYLRPGSTGPGAIDSVAFFPTVALARLPAISPQQAEFLVAEAMEYSSEPELGPWQNKIVLVADDDRVGSKCDDIGEGRHTDDAEYLSDYVYPQVFERKKIYLTEYPRESTGLKPRAKDDFVKALNQGALISNFIGHGDPNRLAQEEVFNPAAVEMVSTGRRQSFFIAASCNVSKFDEPDLTSMAERLLARPGGGTIGSLASTHLCSAQSNFVLNVNFIGALFDSMKKYPTIPVADAVAIAKALTVATAFGFWRNDEMYALFGDPALELASPQLGIRFQSPLPDTLKRQAVYSFSGQVYDGDLPVEGYHGSVDIQAEESEDTTGYVSTICPGRYFDYDLPGASIFRGITSIEEGGFDFSMFVAASARPGPRASIRCFLTDGMTSGSGLVDSLLISGLVPSDDEVGPEVELSYQGRTIDSGDTVIVGQRIDLRLTDDESGVAFKGKSDFIPAVSVRFDDGDPWGLADSLYAVNGDYREAVASFVIPQLASGEHVLTIAAFNNVNKLTTRVYALTVGTSAAGAANVVYAYPNPAPGSCHIIWEYESDKFVEVQATIYTLAGRRIWRGSTSGRGSYHWIEWNGTDSAGDRVANGTYLAVVEATSPTDPEFSTSDKIAIALMR